MVVSKLTVVCTLSTQHNTKKTTIGTTTAVVTTAAATVAEAVTPYITERYHIKTNWCGLVFDSSKNTHHDKAV